MILDQYKWADESLPKLKEEMGTQDVPDMFDADKHVRLMRTNTQQALEERAIPIGLLTK